MVSAEAGRTGAKAGSLLQTHLLTSDADVTSAASPRSPHSGPGCDLTALRSMVVTAAHSVTSYIFGRAVFPRAQSLD